MVHLRDRKDNDDQTNNIFTINRPSLHPMGPQATLSFSPVLWSVAANRGPPAGSKSSMSRHGQCFCWCVRCHLLVGPSFSPAHFIFAPLAPHKLPTHPSSKFLECPQNCPILALTHPTPPICRCCCSFSSRPAVHFWP